MEIAKKKLGILLSTGPDHPNLETALGLGDAALSRGADLYLYLIDDGVRALGDLRLPEAPHSARGRSRDQLLRPGRADRRDQRHRPLRRAELSARSSPWLTSLR